MRLHHTLSSVFVAWCLLSCSAGDTRTNRTEQAASPAGSGVFLAACSDGHDCAEGLCLGLSTGDGICTHACTRDVDCPRGSNWACGHTEETSGAVCVCLADSPDEICGDGRDNDCDGKLDDCLMCGAKLVQPNDRLHCGACGKACSAGAVCEDRACVCPAGAVDCTLDTEATCHDAADCDDHVACTEDACVSGTCASRARSERCGPGTSCDPRAALCVAGAVCANDDDCNDADPCTVFERCEPGARRCTYDVLDGDGDGHAPAVCGGDDCNDSDADVVPGHAELCDGEDNDCDGAKDEAIADDVCGEGMACGVGKCICAPGRVACSTGCMDLSRDDDHCGACGNACTSGTECHDGLCECPVDSVLCRGECRAPDSFANDAQNCGGCGVRCALDTEMCRAGACECSASAVRCGDACVSESAFETSSAHCGGCGQACAGTCVAGVCAMASAVVASVASTCVLLSDARTACFGAIGGSLPSVLRDDHAQAITELTRIVINDAMPGPYLCALSAHGALWCGGDGLLRERRDATVLQPVFAQGLVPLENVVDVQLGGDASCALLADGRVFCWGPNSQGGVGAGASGESVLALPVQTESGSLLDDAVAISLFPLVGHACAVRADGSVSCWGANQYDEAAPGSASLASTATLVRAENGIALSAVRGVSVGAGASCAVFVDGGVWCWGNNTLGQLGRPTDAVIGQYPRSVRDGLGHPLSGALDLYAQYGAFCAFGAGNVQCWGVNGQAQLGDGSTTTRAYASPVLGGVSKLALGSASHHCALRGEGALLCWGDGAAHGSVAVAGNTLYPQPVRRADGSDVTFVHDVAVGGQHTCLIDAAHALACWGDNSRGQLGGSDASTALTPRVVRF